MMKNYRFRKIKLIVGLLFLGSQSLLAQLSGNVSIPTDYASIAAFVTDLNTQGVGPGGITLDVPAGYTETAPATGIQLTATGSLGNPIIIQKSGAGTNPIISAGSGGVGTPGVAVQDGVFALIGSDYVTIDGIDITDPNSTNPSTMEWGYGLFKASATNGCQNNVIKNCVITLNRVNNATGLTTSFDGSKGINMTNAVISAQTTVVTVTSPAGSNSFNQFYSNTIQNVNIGIALAGFADITPFANADTGNDIGGSSLATGNTIINFGGAAAATNPAAGVRTSSQYNLNVSYNTINNNVTGINHVSTLRGILIGAATSASLNITYNNVTIVSGATTSLMEGISNAGGSTAASNTVNINNNNVQVAYPTATSGLVNAILNSSTAAIVNMNFNTVSNVSGLAPASNVLAGTGTMLMMDGGSGVILNMNNNTVSNLTRTGASGTIRAIRFASPTTGNVNNNLVENITFTAAASTGGIDGIYGLSSSVDMTINNNIIRNLSTPTTGTINGIREYGITGIKVITNNQIYNFSTTAGGAGGASFNGIFCSAGTVNISGNTIYSLNSAGSTGGTAGSINGVQISITTSPWSVFKNKIYGLSTNSTGTGNLVNGILAASGSGNIYNNVIGSLTVGASAGTDAVRGISLTSTTAASTIGIFYNTVYLNGTSTGANFGSSGIFHTGSTTATTAALNLRNNIIINESTPNGTGLSVAFRRGTANAANLAATSNNNLLYAGTPGANRLIYTDGTTPQQTIAGFQGVVLPLGHDLNTFTGEAAFTVNGYGTSGNFFISLTGSSTDFLRPVAAIVTQAESGAQNISTPAITDDYSASVRAGNAGYTGLGTNPDVGAYEFQGVSPAPIIVLNSVAPAASTQCISSNRAVSVEVTTLSGTITTVNLVYAVNGVAQAGIAMINTSGNTWTATIPAPTPANATISWGVTASNSIGLNSSYSGSTYSDEPLTGITASIAATLTTLCSGSPTTLLASLTNSNTQTYTAPTAVTNILVDEDLRNITITQGATTLLNNTTNYNTLLGTIGTATGTAGSYSNFTSFPPTNLVAGTTYGLSATVVDSNNAFYYDKGVGVYIDYNRNGLFNDPGENVYISPVSPLPQTSLYTFTSSFTVPSSVSNGLTRMRVIANEGIVTSPTMTVSYGEFEEYTILLSGSTAGINSVSWSDGTNTVGTSNPITVNPTITTTYTANITALGCPVSPSPTSLITVNPLPSAPIASNSLQCGTQIPTASITSTSALPTPTFVWYDAAVGGNVLQSSTSTTYSSNVSATTTYHVSELNVATGCESTRTPITVTVQAADGISASATTPTTFCIGSSVSLSAANINPTPNQTYTYTWTGAAGSGLSTSTGSTVTFTPTTSGTYTIGLSGVDGGCNAVSQISITVDPFLATVAPVAATCNGVANGTFTLNTSSCGTQPFTYSIDGGTTFTAIPTNLAAGTYSVIVKDANNFVTSGQSIIVTEPSTTISVPTATNATICVGDASASVSATSFTSVPTSGSTTVSFNLAAQPTEVSGLSAFPTTAANPNIIMTATMPSLPAGATITGATFTMNGLTALGGSWQSDLGIGFTGAVNAGYASGTGVANTSGAFNYSRTLAAGAINAAGGTINIHYYDLYNDNTTAGATAESTFPTGNGIASLVINYTTPSPATISWWDAPTGGNQIGTGSSLNAIGTSVLPNSNTAGVYTLYAQGQNGACPSPARGAATVTINALPIVNAGIDQTVCSGSSVSLSGSGADTYAWNNGVTNAVAFSVSNTNSYTVTGTNSSTGCANTDQVSITVNALPIVNAGIDNAICFGQTVTLNGSGALIYSWNNGVTNNVAFTPSSTLSYGVAGTDLNGCVGNDTVTVTVNALPNISAGLDTTLCSGSSIALSGSGGVSYSWNNGIQNAVSFTASTNSTYTVTGTDANGCVNTDDVQVNVYALPNVNAGNDFTVCQNAQISLSASGASAYIWDNNVVNGVPFAITGTTSYSVTGTDANGCQATDNITVSTNALPNVDAGNTIEQCGDQNVTLTATGAVTYVWNNGVQNAVSFQSPFGTTAYIVTGIDAFGCSNTDIVNVTINVVPSAQASAANAITLVASPSNAYYQWINCSDNSSILGATGSTFTATANGNYAVIITGNGGCADTSACVVVDQVELTDLGVEFGLELYPNPTRDNFSVNFNKVESLSITIFDYQGKLIVANKTIKSGDQIDMSKYENGVYTIEMTDENLQTIVRRVIKN